LSEEIANQARSATQAAGEDWARLIHCLLFLVSDRVWRGRDARRNAGFAFAAHHGYAKRKCDMIAANV
jgi:hypothetical protein